MPPHPRSHVASAVEASNASESRAHLFRRDRRSKFGQEPICEASPPDTTRTTVPHSYALAVRVRQTLSLRHLWPETSAHGKRRNAHQCGSHSIPFPTSRHALARTLPSSRSLRNTFRPGAAMVGTGNRPTRESSRASERRRTQVSRCTAYIGGSTEQETAARSRRNSRHRPVRAVSFGDREHGASTAPVLRRAKASA